MKFTVHGAGVHAFYLKGEGGNGYIENMYFFRSPLINIKQLNRGEGGG